MKNVVLVVLALLWAVSLPLSAETMWTPISLGNAYDGFHPNQIAHGVICGYTREGAATWQKGEIIMIPALPGYHFSASVAMNNRGDVVVNAFSWPNGGEYATRSYFVVSQNGQITEIDFLTGINGIVNALNDRGQVTGFYTDGLIAQSFGFIWENGEIIAKVPGVTFHDINNAGTTIGSMGFDQNQRAYYFDGELHALETPPAPSGSIALAINERGQIVGEVIFPDLANGQFVWQPALWEKGKLTILPTIQNLSGAAEFVNDQGDILGEIENPNSWQRLVCLWKNSKEPVIVGEHLTSPLVITDIFGIDNQRRIICYGSPSGTYFDSGFFLLDPR